MAGNKYSDRTGSLWAVGLPDPLRRAKAIIAYYKCPVSCTDGLHFHDSRDLGSLSNVTYLSKCLFLSLRNAHNRVIYQEVNYTSPGNLATRDIAVCGLSS